MEATSVLGANWLLFSSNPTRKEAHYLTSKASASLSPLEKKENIDIRVCTNRTCRKQGALDILPVLLGIAPPYVSVSSCGCLGRCGSGPNIIVLPEDAFIGHCGTPSKAASVMARATGFDDDDGDSVKRCLEALSLRKRAEEEIGRGDFSQAYSLLSQAIYLKPFGGIHIIYKDRSRARLAMGDIDGALEDAKDALDLAPHYPEAYICEGDTLMAMDQFSSAEKSYSVALDLDPSLRRSKSFKARLAKLREKLALANLG